MNGFIVIGAAMCVMALLCVVVPLARQRRPQDAAAGVVQTNLSILRDQLAELQADLSRGTISAGQYSVARAELERRALEEAAATRSVGPFTQRGARWAPIALGVAIPLAAFSMYAWIGEPAGLRREAVAAERPVGPAEIEKMVAGLAQRLEKNPDDPRGWTMLARSYYVMRRMPEAAAAYAKAAEKIKDDADLYADYADALAMSQGRRIDGAPLKLVMQALAIDPVQPKALAMAGTESFNRKDYPGALGYWEKLLPLLPPQSEMAKSVADGIAQARELGKIRSAQTAVAPTKQAPKPASGTALAGSVSGRVTLSPVLAAKAGPQDTLFIVARALNGPRIPLAVLRRRVADLPIDFALDDTQAMSPELKLSAFSDVIVTARISKSGNAISQPGDLQGASPPVKVGASGLAIVIDSVVP